MTPFYDMVAGLGEFRAELDEAWHRVLNRGSFILGEELDAFEAEFASYCGAAHCVGVSSGLDALSLTLRALEIGPGDEIIVPSHTFIATWLAVSAVGATPVPVEPRSDTMNINPDAIEQAITSKTRAIIPVHLYGQPAEMFTLLQLAERHKLFLVEDAAQAHGARYHTQRLGSLTSTATAFSFYPSKNLGALGDAGAVVTNNTLLADRLRLLRNYGSPSKYDHPTAGTNSRLDELQAALLRVKLRYLDADNARRKHLASVYSATLSEFSNIKTPTVIDGADPVWHLYVIRVAQGRDFLSDHLRQRSIQTLVHYPRPCHLQGVYAELNLPPNSLPISEELGRTVLSLPLWPQMSEDTALHVAQSIREWHAS